MKTCASCNKDLTNLVQIACKKGKAYCSPSCADKGPQTLAAPEYSVLIEVALGEMEDVCEVDCDDCCSAGHVIDGCTGEELFLGGFALAQKAVGKKVFWAAREYTAYFFIGEEAEICGKILGEELARRSKQR